MKRLLYIALILIALAGCKTTEENYRNAYEVTKAKKTAAIGDSTITDKLIAQNLPKMTKAGNDTLPMRTEIISVTPDGGGTPEKVGIYNVVVGEFRQVFNARSMQQRLVAQGYEDAMVVHDRYGKYYVVAESFNVARDAKAMLEHIKADKQIIVRSPFPYVLRRGALIR